MALMWQNVRFLGQIEDGLSSTPRVQKLSDGEEQPEHIATSRSRALMWFQIAADKRCVASHFRECRTKCRAILIISNRVLSMLSSGIATSAKGPHRCLSRQVDECVHTDGES